MSRDDIARSAVAILVIVGFFVVIVIVLIGLVDVRDPTIAKLVGLLFGYLTAMLNPIIVRYFGGNET